MPSETSVVTGDQSLEELRRELTEAREQQAATAEILASISSSMTDANQVFAKIAASAARLCDAHDVTIFQVHGDSLRIVDHHGPIPPGGTLPLTRGVLAGRAVLDRRAIHVTDMQVESDKYPEGSYRARLLGHRTILAVPLIHASKAIGVISIRRTEVRPFTDRQIELLKTFADQAVIAIENTRLFEAEQSSKRKLQETLYYQTAISEVLSVISRSPSQIAPVMETIANTARKLCQAERAIVWRIEGHAFRPVAFSGMDADRIGQVLEYRLPLGSGSTLGRAAQTGRAVQILDTLSEPGFGPVNIALSRSGNVRTVFAVPLLRDGNAIGGITLSRTVVAPFTDPQIALVETFADQAVIAIENARLFEAEQTRTRELTERTQELTQTLEYQTATSDVLNVISRSPSNLSPVLDAIVKTAVRLCQADFADFRLLRDGVYHLAATTADEGILRSSNPIVAGRGSVTGRAALEQCPVHVPDIRADPEYTHVPTLEQPRTILAVPLLRDGVAVGVIVLFKRLVKPFTQKQIALVSTFADQALIAIENTRLFEEVQAKTGELTEALEQQTATSEVLKVISSSPGELEPVFQTIVENAVRVCDAQFGTLFQYDGKLLHRVAGVGTPPALVEFMEQRGPFLPPPTSRLHDMLQTKQVQHIVDAAADAVPSVAARFGGARSLVHVPMLKDDELVGAIVIYRQEVRPFTDKQIELVNSFAAQAVIAIENVRLLNELRESLQQQTATADVLKVISRATFNLPRVLDTLVESAATLCDSYDASILQNDGDVLRIVAYQGPIPHTRVGQPRRMTRRAAIWRAILNRQTIHLTDAQSETDEYPETSALARRFDFHTMLTVPLVGAGEAVGAITLRRSEVRPFTDRQIELLQTFADQAVIAIENARLFEEVQTRTKELQESLERQTATSEVLGVISRSPNEVQPVLDTIVATAYRLCQAERAVIWRLEDETFRAVAHRGQPEERVESLLSARMPLSRGSMLGRATLARRAVQVEDVATDPELVAALSRAGNVRTFLAVPLLLKGDPIGVITLARTRVAPFDDKQVALVESFADQAVIAIENARLFEAEQASKRELTESLEQQTATADVLKVISRSALDVQKVLDALVESAARLCNAPDAGILQVIGDSLRLVAHHGQIPTTGPVGQITFPLVRGGIGAHAVIDRRTIHVADMLAEADEYPRSQNRALQHGWRTALAVPLVHAGEAIGVILIRRTEVRPFTERQIELVNTFADQAVIAIENSRLFEEVQARTKELQDSLDRQTATSEVLGVISRSPNEVQPVLDTIVATAQRLCRAERAVVWRLEGETFRAVAHHGLPEER